MRDARILEAPAPSAPGPGIRSRGGRIALLVAGGLAVLLLIALGSWQVHRLRWKLDLIAIVDARVHAPPVAPPAPPAWPAVTADADQYLHVTARGTYDDAGETFVQAVTDYGPGFWLVTPFHTDAGFTVLVNRGFVPPDRRSAASRAAGEISGETAVTGLLRVDEPGGAFLRHNDPAADRWFSRDVGAIAAKRGLAGPVAPYFIDADDAPVPGGFPVGGLTVVAFPNNHLVYAITWYAMGLGLAGALVWGRPRGAGAEAAARQGAAMRATAALPVSDALAASFAGDVGGGPGGEDASGHKNLLLLVQLRWIAVGGQLATLAVVGAGLRVVLPIGPMAGVMLGLVLLNAGSLVRLSRPAPVVRAELALAMLLDIGALTLQLGLTGGATNPFIFLYLLQVTLAAVLLDGAATWAVVAVTALCFGGLTRAYRPLDLTGLPGADLFALHIAGMLICFLLDAGLLVVFLTRVMRNLRERDARLAALRQRAAEEDGIVRMGLLASGAAHLLGTPLSTLSVILGDWRRMPALNGDPELMGELDVLEAEVRRCKAILTGILVSAGEARGESAAATTLDAFLDELVADWRGAHPAARLRYGGVAQDLAIVSDTALKQVIVNLLDNAFEVSPGWLRLRVGLDGGLLRLSVQDRGPGFAPEILAEVGTPYRSTKGRQGGGLGLFLVVNVVRKLGGRVTVGNRPGGGAAVAMALPVSALAVPGGSGRRREARARAARARAGKRPMPDARLLVVVDDDESFARTLKRSFERRGYEVVVAPALPDVKALLEGRTPAFAVVDLKLAGASGLACLDALHAHDPDMLIVVLTGFASIATAVESIKLGACHYLAKPANTDDIEAAFSRGAGDAAVPLGERATSIKTLEWERIHEVLAETGFNISETARRLGMHRRTLARKAGEAPGDVTCGMVSEGPRPSAGSGRSPGVIFEDGVRPP